MTVTIVIPVYNEESILEDTVKTVVDYLRKNPQEGWELVIADNASTDRTLEIAKRLEKKHNMVKALHIPQKGRGRALKKAWGESGSDIMMYMDADLSSDLSYVPALVNSLKGGADIAIGNRLKGGSETRRSLFREIFSRGYNVMLKLIFWDPGFTDAQCGFKAISRRAAKELLPKVRDNEWFFDTELLIRAHKAGYKIEEIPIKWVEEGDSKVKIIKTVWQYFRNSIALKVSLLFKQLE